MWENEHFDQGDATVFERVGLGSQGWAHHHQWHGGPWKLTILWPGIRGQLNNGQNFALLVFWPALFRKKYMRKHDIRRQNYSEWQLAVISRFENSALFLKQVKNTLNFGWNGTYGIPHLQFFWFSNFLFHNFSFFLFAILKFLDKNLI